MLKLLKKALYLSLVICCITSLLSCGRRGNGKGEEEKLSDTHVPTVVIDTTYAGLRLFFPSTDSMALRCFVRPEPSTDKDIVFCCAAAFTLDYETQPDHNRICSAHVSEGEYYKKPRIRRNTGAFVASHGRWKFLYQEDANPAAFNDDFQDAADNHGAGFAQEMMIHNGQQVKTTRPLSNVNLFRALCEKDNRLCIADATETESFGEFINSLIAAGISEAIYTDMGYGWNYSWYREYAGKEATFIHPDYQACATNWLVFYATEFPL